MDRREGGRSAWSSATTAELAMWWAGWGAWSGVNGYCEQCGLSAAWSSATTMELVMPAALMLST